MVIIFVLVLFFAIFFAIRKHMGPAVLASIAGVAVAEVFSPQILQLLHNINFGLPDGKSKALIYLIFVVGFPMILYFKSSRGGMFGLLRIAEALLLSALITSLLAGSIAEWFSFDDLSRQILSFINANLGIIMMVGIGTAYLDILFYRS
ncbi:MAG: hypothetical protein Q4A25_00835 [Candidatus Saccharibacteria bacterium]|nr:hypothetical protein [Candidatus Saccharibacteria bacterium]